jgi:HK97 family phage prohead protease
MKKIICKTKATTQAEYCFSGYASVFNVPDANDDIILPGAFRSSFTIASEVKMLWQHDPKTPIGTFSLIQETPEGLYVEGQLIISTPKGREAYELITNGAVDGLSIGFEIKEQYFENGRRCISKVRLWEISIVTFPANEMARIRPVRASVTQGLVEDIDKHINTLCLTTGVFEKNGGRY